MDLAYVVEDRHTACRRGIQGVDGPLDQDGIDREEDRVDLLEGAEGLEDRDRRDVRTSCNSPLGFVEVKAASSHPVEGGMAIYPSFGVKGPLKLLVQVLDQHSPFLPDAALSPTPRAPCLGHCRIRTGGVGTALDPAAHVVHRVFGASWANRCVAGRWFRQKGRSVHEGGILVLPFLQVQAQVQVRRLEGLSDL